MAYGSAFSGSGGSVSFGTAYSGHVYGWNVSKTIDEIDASDFSNFATGRAYIPGMYSWSGSYNCRLDDTEAVTFGEGTVMALQLKGSGTGRIICSGTAFVTSIDESLTLDAVGEVTISFRGSGQLFHAASY